MGKTSFSERVPNAAVLSDIDAMFDFEQVLAEEMVTTVEHPIRDDIAACSAQLGSVQRPGRKIVFRTGFRGERGGIILQRAGYEAGEIACFGPMGVIGG